MGEGVLIVLEWFAVKSFFCFWGEKKSTLAAYSGMAHWSTCQVHKRNPGRTGKPAEGQALKCVFFVSRSSSRVPREWWVQCHQLAENEITIYAYSASVHGSTFLLLWWYILKEEFFQIQRRNLLLIDNLHCMGCSLLEAPNFQPLALKVRWHKHPAMLLSWSCNGLCLRTDLCWSRVPLTSPSV